MFRFYRVKGEDIICVMTPRYGMIRVHKNWIDWKGYRR